MHDSQAEPVPGARQRSITALACIRLAQAETGCPRISSPVRAHRGESTALGPRRPAALGARSLRCARWDSGPSAPSIGLLAVRISVGDLECR